ncbi:thiol-disulfide isomerase/thioredoxin [Chitinophaga sp. W3I9]|uniref:TlpA family protein disulfide reductase n=1 Tax=Chitinophaga sp. W3I9 TaxID=3373924 RepID=UPI003D22B445
MIKKELTKYVVTLISGLLLFVVLGNLMGIPILSKSKKIIFIHPQQTGKENQLLPTFNIILADSSTTNINTDNIPVGKPIVLFYFSPYCPFCKMEMKEIVKNINRLGNIEFYILTPYSFTEMKNFYDEFDLKRFNNIKTGIDNQLFIGKYFNTVSIPYIAIYGQDKRLNGAFVGNVNSDQIIAVSKL